MPDNVSKFSSCLKKQSDLIDLFSTCADSEAIYTKVITLGRSLSSMDKQFQTEDRLVKGCQSLMYLRSWQEDGTLYFEAHSDALISAGLASLMIRVYSGESPESILLCAPTFLETIGILGSLSPNRSNGLASLHIKMKQEALKAQILIDKK